jgi:exopolysaccharide production protein ExoQ
MLEFISIFVYGLVAFLLPICLVLGVAFTLHLGLRRDDGLMPYMFYPILSVIALTGLLSGRNLDFVSDLALLTVDRHPIVGLVSKLTSLFIVFGATERILRHLFLPTSKVVFSKVLVFSFCLYFVSSVLASALFGAHSTFSYEYFYPALAGVAALLMTKNDGDTAIVSARNALLIFLILSAICVVVRPQMVLTHGYQGYVPFIRFRYAGLTHHPNAFGPLTVVFLLALSSKPFQKNWHNYLGWALGLISLILTQSKTSWICFVLCVPCISYFRYGTILKQRVFDLKRPYFLISIILSLMLLSVIITLTVVFGSFGDKINAFFATREGGDLLTMTGRNQIWAIAFREWARYPIFGYGLSLWDDAFRAQIGLPAAYHAHNQFVQVLASAGLFGAFGLVVYSIALLWFSLKTARSSSGLSLALFMMMFIRAISEVPLAMHGYGFEQIGHLLLLMVIAGNFSKTSIAPVKIAQGPQPFLPLPIGLR